MNKSTYTFEPVEVAVRELRLDGLSPARWLICLGYEEQEGRGRYVGTVWSMKNSQPVRVGDKGEARRVMKGLVEASLWWRSVSGVRG